MASELSKKTIDILQTWLLGVKAAAELIRLGDTNEGALKAEFDVVQSLLGTTQEVSDRDFSALHDRMTAVYGRLNSAHSIDTIQCPTCGKQEMVPMHTYGNHYTTDYICNGEEPATPDKEYHWELCGTRANLRALLTTDAFNDLVLIPPNS